MTRLPRILALTLFAAASSSAQDAAEIEVRLLSFPKRLEPAKLEVRVKEDATLPVELPSNTLSDPVKLPRLPVWQFGHTTTLANGESGFEVLAECRPLASRKQLVIAAFTGDREKPEIRMTVLDISGFKARQFLLMNLSPKETAAQIGGKRFRLKPGQHRIIEPAADRGENLCFASLFTEIGGVARPFFSSNWPILEESRGLVFIYQKSGASVPGIHTIVDVLPPG